MAFFSQNPRALKAWLHTAIETPRWITDWAKGRRDPNSSWLATFQHATQALDYQFLEKPCMHAESTLRQAGINSPHRYRQNAMMLLSKTLHHNWLSTSRSSWDEKHKQCPALFEQFRPVFNTPGTLMIPMAFQELFQHYGWNDDDTVAFMTAAYCHVAELDYAGKMGKLQRDGTMPRSTFKGLTFSQDTPFHSNQDAASLCFELMCMGHTDFQYLLFDADRTERGWYAEMLDIIWSRHPTLAQTLRPIVELGCPYNERGEPTPCPMEVYALARASQPKVDVPQWALPELHA